MREVTETQFFDAVKQAGNRRLDVMPFPTSGFSSDWKTHQGLGNLFGRTTTDGCDDWHFFLA